MDNISQVEMTANQSGKFDEKDSFAENTGQANMASDKEGEVPYK
jgi:hypothetical protein